jgi:hypothetical protein
MNPTMRPDPAPGCDDAVRPYLRAFSHVNIFSDHRIRPDAHADRNPRQWRHNSLWMDSRRDRRPFQQPCRGLCKGNFRMRVPQHRLSRNHHAVCGNHAERSRCNCARYIFRRFHIDQIVWPSPLRRGHSVQLNPSVAFQARPNISR